MALVLIRLVAASQILMGKNVKFGINQASSSITDLDGKKLKLLTCETDFDVFLVARQVQRNEVFMLAKTC